LTQTPASASGGEASQAPPNTAAAIAALDHFPKLWRNSRRPTSSSSDGVMSIDG